MRDILEVRGIWGARDTEGSGGHGLQCGVQPTEGTGGGGIRIDAQGAGGQGIQIGGL